MLNEENRRSLPVELTAEERASKALRMSLVHQEIELAEAAAKAHAQTAKEKIKRLEADESDLAECVRTGKEYRRVDVYRKANLTLRTWEIRRGDTGELVESEAMSDAEWREATQEKLPFQTSGVRFDSKKREEISAAVDEVRDPGGKGATLDHGFADEGLHRAPPPSKKSKLHPAPLTATVAELAESTACINALCGVKLAPGDSRKGRCRACADFLRRNGTERHPKWGPMVVDETTGSAS